MSDSDYEDSPCHSWSDLESDPPRTSLTDSAIKTSVNMSASLPTKPKLEPWFTGIAVEQAQPPIGGLQWVKHHWKGRDPIKRRNF